MEGDLLKEEIGIMLIKIKNKIDNKHEFVILDSNFLYNIYSLLENISKNIDNKNVDNEIKRTPDEIKIMVDELNNKIRESHKIQKILIEYICRNTTELVKTKDKIRGFSYLF
jgi:hypothetical protein